MRVCEPSAEARTGAMSDDKSDAAPQLHAQREGSAKREEGETGPSYMFRVDIGTLLETCPYPSECKIL